MKLSNDELAKLLNLDHLFALYTKIGDSINTDIDLQNSGFDFVSRDNSIALLEKCGFITREDDVFLKTRTFDDIDSFSVQFLKTIHVAYSNIIAKILSLDKKYDETRNLFYISRNDIDLCYAGLTMILGDLGFVQMLDNRHVYLLDNEESRRYLQEVRGETVQSRKQLTLVELEHGLVIKKHLGEIGEQKALEYEIKLLKEQGINKVPRIISDTDVGAGYDIASYSSPTSEVCDKFIEVKSCQDMQQAFYLSQNELKAAQKKAEQYYLYLYIRSEDRIIVINNPYEEVYASDKWQKEPQVYRFSKKA